MKNQKKVLSRGKILEHVWDINADPTSVRLKFVIH